MPQPPDAFEKWLKKFREEEEKKEMDGTAKQYDDFWDEQEAELKQAWHACAASMLKELDKYTKWSIKMAFEPAEVIRIIMPKAEWENFKRRYASEIEKKE